MEKVIVAFVGGILTLAFVAFAAKVGQELRSDVQRQCPRSESESSSAKEVHLWLNHQSSRQTSAFSQSGDPSPANLHGG